MTWSLSRLSDFLVESKGKIKFEDANRLGLQRIKKIDFSGNIHLDDETDTKTDMILVKSGDLVISGINASKGAISVYEGEQDILATIHYSSYEFNPDLISIIFLKWFFKSSIFNDLLSEQIAGGIKTELKASRILPLQIKVPNLSEQIFLADRLDRFQNKELRLQAEIKNQENYFETLRKAIIFDALCGKLTTKWRANNKSEDIHKLTKSNSIGLPFDLPETWTSSRLGEVSQLISGASFLSTDFSKGIGIKCIKITNAGVRELVETDDVLPVIFAEKYKKNKVHKGDLILALTRPYISNGLKVSICPSSYDGALLNQRVAGIRVNEEILHTEFAFLFMRSDVVLKIYQAEFDAKGQQPNLKNEHVTKLIIPIPPLAEQAEIISKVAKLEKHLDHAIRELNSIKRSKDMLNKAMLKEAFFPAS